MKYFTIMVMNSFLSMINFHNHEESKYLTILDGIFMSQSCFACFAILDPFKVDGSYKPHHIFHVLFKWFDNKKVLDCEAKSLLHENN
jgi:hypothetical protein